MEVKSEPLTSLAHAVSDGPLLPQMAPANAGLIIGKKERSLRVNTVVSNIVLVAKTTGSGIQRLRLLQVILESPLESTVIPDLAVRAGGLFPDDALPFQV